MRRLLPLLIAVPVLTVSVLAGCGERGGSPRSAATGPGWDRLADVPLSKRTAPVVAWTGSEVLAVGGEVGTTCSPMADCADPNESARDGAALDPATGRWREISAAPLPIPSYSPAEMVAGHWFVRVDRTLLDYDVVADRWRMLRRAVSPWYDLVADGNRLILVSGSDEQVTMPDLVYDVAQARWSQLPDDPIGPAFDRGMVATRRGLLLLAHELVDNPGADGPTLLLAALLDPVTRQWRRLPDADIIGGGNVSVVGDRVILPSLDATNGGGEGDGDYGRMVRFGGRLDLSRSTWSPLPHAPEYLTGGWSVDAPGNRLLAAEGWLYDDATETWTQLPRPPGAPDRPGPAVWTGDRLVVVTGTFSADDWDHIRDMGAWWWTPKS